MASHSILIIEDEENIAKLIASAMKKEGYAVQTAPDGDTGLDIQNSAPADLIILDVMLRRKIEEDLEDPKLVITVRGRGFRLNV